MRVNKPTVYIQIGSTARYINIKTKNKKLTKDQLQHATNQLMFAIKPDTFLLKTQETNFMTL